MRTVRLLRGSVVLLWILTLSVACSPEGESTESAASRPTGGGTAVFGSSSDLGNLNPYLTRGTFDFNVLSRVYLRLAAPSAGPSTGPAQFDPSLAESWSFSEDRLSLTFRLREAVWSDGAPLTAADVRFTWEAQTSESVPWVSADTKEAITDVEVLDARTAVFHFDRVYAYQLADAVEGSILPRHVFGRIPFADWIHHDWSTVRIGSGPFLVADYRPLRQITLERNPAYWREGFPRLDRIFIRIAPDTGSLITQLRAGDLHFIDGVPPRDAAGLAKNPALKVIPFDSGYTALGWNGARPPFDDPAVRRALTLAIDREALAEDLLYGFGRVAVGPVLSTSWAADKTLKPWPHDPDAARAALAERGFGPQRPLRFKLITNSGNSLREATQIKLQEQFSRIGVEVSVTSIEVGALRQRTQAGDYDAFIVGWVFAGKIDLGVLFGSNGGLNMLGYRSAVTDRLLDRIAAATDADELKTAYDAVQQQLHQDQPYSFLFETPRIAVHRGLNGVRIDVPGDPWSHLEEYGLAAP